MAAYEAKMFVRAAEGANGAMEGLGFLADDALPHRLERFRSMGDALVSNASSRDD